MSLQICIYPLEITIDSELVVEEIEDNFDGQVPKRVQQYFQSISWKDIQQEHAITQLGRIISKSTFYRDQYDLDINIEFIIYPGSFVEEQIPYDMITRQRFVDICRELKMQFTNQRFTIFPDHTTTDDFVIQLTNEIAQIIQ